MSQVPIGNILACLGHKHANNRSVPFVLLLEDKNTKTHYAAILFMQPQRSKEVAHLCLIFLVLLMLSMNK